MNSDAPLRLDRVAVRGLFGIFNHDIPLDTPGDLTIIAGANGVGKTIMLKMIVEVLRMSPIVSSHVGAS
jgi:predicted ATP-binding protein involved in virulence